MDPKAAVRNWLAAETAAERTEAMNAYNAWAKGGGFLARVATHPASDVWMRGDRFGDVFKLGRKFVTVRGNSKRVWKMSARNILEVV